MRAFHERFWAAVNKTDSCWLWTASTVGLGYGRIRREGKNVRAHRAAWEIVGGAIPDGLWVLHTCDNPACVRNDDEGTYEVNGVLHPRRGHLWLGTEQDNTDDMIAKERNARGERYGSVTHPEKVPRGSRNGVRTHPEKIARGERHPGAKLSWDAVHDIRLRYRAREATQRDLASRFGVTQRRINMIVRGIAWKE